MIPPIPVELLKIKKLGINVMDKWINIMNWCYKNYEKLGTLKNTEIER